MDVGDWLRGLGLGRYETVFRDNEIDVEVLRELTESDLEKLGCAAGASQAPAQGDCGRRRDRDCATHGDGSPGRAGRRAPAAHRDVLRPRRLDRTVGAARSRGHARDHFAPIRRCCAETGATQSAASSPSIWATACSPISAIRRRTRTTPSGRCEAGWRSSRRCRKLKTAAGVPLQARVGIATGLVVVGDLIGSGQRRSRPSSARRRTCRPAAGDRRAEQRGHRRGHAQAARQSVRTRRSRQQGAQGHRRAGACLARRCGRARWKAASRRCTRAA